MAPGTCASVRWPAALGVGHRQPAHEAVLLHPRDLQTPAGEVRVAVGGEAVKAGVALVLGEVDLPAPRVHACRLVLEGAHRGPRHGAARPARVALPDQAGLDFLAGEPGAPGGDAAGAVGRGAGKDPVGALRLAAGAEADRRGAAEAPRHLRVGDQHEAAVAAREGAHRVGEDVPGVGRAADGLVGPRDQPRPKPRRKRDPVGVGGAERAVGAAAGSRPAGERLQCLAQQARVERQRGGARPGPQHRPPREHA